MKKKAFSLLFLVFLLSGCSVENSKDSNKPVANSTGTQAVTKNNVDSSKEASTTATNNLFQQKDTNSNDNIKNESNKKQSFTERVKDYISKDQIHSLEERQVKWSRMFLNRLDMEGLYKKYLSDGGEAENVESFIKYMTANAPIPKDWEKLVTKDIYNTYEQNVTEIEHFKDDLYRTYITKNGYKVPYVVVSARTGYFHSL